LFLRQLKNGIDVDPPSREAMLGEVAGRHSVASLPATDETAAALLIKLAAMGRDGMKGSGVAEELARTCL